MIRVSASVLALLLAFSAPAVRAQAPVPGLGTYTYDGAGNVTATGSHTFHYDAFGRLKKASFGAGKSQEYIYDGYGNIVEVVTDGNTAAPLRLAVDPRTNRLDHLPTRATHADATYDAGGNIIATELGDEFAYDGVGMVTAWKAGSTQKIHLYTAGDERLATITLINDVQQRTDWTVRDGGGKVLRRFSSIPSGTWSWEEDYIYRDGQLLAAEVPGPARTLHFHLDHLGTPRLITGNGGAQVAQHTYYPFGKELTSPGQDSEPMKFTGHERDGAALDYMHARYYMAEWGRFLSVDPVLDMRRAMRQPQAWNRYSYVLNNPINRIDPDGRADRKSELASMASGFLEPLGSIQDAIIAATGFDIITAEQQDLPTRIASAGAVFIPVVGGKLGGKLFNEVFASAARQTNWGNAATLGDHFARHGADFGARNSTEYAKMASDFLKTSQANKLPTKVGSDGTIRVYDPKTNTFAAYNKDGTTKTFYKPDPKKHGYKTNQEYWDAQPGKLVQ